jgi:hypothetical protein
MFFNKKSIYIKSIEFSKQGLFIKNQDGKTVLIIRRNFSRIEKEALSLRPPLSSLLEG